MKTKHTTDYQIRPKQKEKFKPAKVKEIMKEVLNAKLQRDQTYSEIQPISKDIADSIKYKLKELGWNRYKFVVHCCIGQQNGQGVRIGGKCFWDFDTDYLAYETFLNDYIFCLVSVYGIYLY